jgi:hypothetical protein
MLQHGARGCIGLADGWMEGTPRLAPSHRAGQGRRPAASHAPLAPNRRLLPGGGGGGQTGATGSHVRRRPRPQPRPPATGPDPPQPGSPAGAAAAAAATTAGKPRPRPHFRDPRGPPPPDVTPLPRPGRERGRAARPQHVGRLASWASEVPLHWPPHTYGQPVPHPPGAIGPRPRASEAPPPGLWPRPFTGPTHQASRTTAPARVSPRLFGWILLKLLNEADRTQKKTRGIS